MTDANRLEQALIAGMQAARDAIEIVMQGAPEEQRQALAQTILQGGSLTVAYGGIPTSAWIEVQLVDRTGKASTLTRLDLPRLEWPPR